MKPPHCSAQRASQLWDFLEFHQNQADSCLVVLPWEAALRCCLFSWCIFLQVIFSAVICGEHSRVLGRRCWAAFACRSGAGSCVQALLLRQMCVHVAGKGQGFSSIPLTLLSNPGLHRVIPAITHLALVANRIWHTDFDGADLPFWVFTLQSVG